MRGTDTLGSGVSEAEARCVSGSHRFARRGALGLVMLHVGAPVPSPVKSKAGDASHRCWGLKGMLQVQF